MKVALVNPRWTFDGSIYFGCREPHLPLEFGYARALLAAAGQPAEIFDAQADGRGNPAVDLEHRGPHAEDRVLGNDHAGFDGSERVGREFLDFHRLLAAAVGEGERAALCAKERICDYDVVNTCLGDAARTFWLYFSRYAERRQSVGYASYGTWTARFAHGEIRRALLGLI